MKICNLKHCATEIVLISPCKLKLNFKKKKKNYKKFCETSTIKRRNAGIAKIPVNFEIVILKVQCTFGNYLKQLDFCQQYQISVVIIFFASELCTKNCKTEICHPKTAFN